MCMVCFFINKCSGVMKRIDAAKGIVNAPFLCASFRASWPANLRGIYDTVFGINVSTSTAPSNNVSLCVVQHLQNNLVTLGFDNGVFIVCSCYELVDILVRNSAKSSTTNPPRAPRDFKGHQGPVTCVIIPVYRGLPFPDKDLIVSGGKDATVFYYYHYLLILNALKSLVVVIVF